MSKEVCQTCHKNPVTYITRKDKDSPKLYVCEQCARASKNRGWVIVSYNIEGGE